MSAHTEDPIRLLTEIKISEYQQTRVDEDSMPNLSEKSIIYAPFNTTLKSEEQPVQIK